jgi:hypothetical protein
VNTTAPVYNPQWTVRTIAMAVYNAEHAFFDANNRFTDSIFELLPYAQAHTLDGTCTRVPTVTLGGNATSFTAEVPSLDGSMLAVIRDDRYLVVKT